MADRAASARKARCWVALALGLAAWAGGSQISACAAGLETAAPAAHARQKLRRQLFLALATLALLYGLVINLRTVVDTDLGWQLATGRYILQHGQIPYRDVFSYTARGQEWIYPPFSGVVFYGAYLLGGFVALSWCGVAACVGLVALLLRAGNMATAVLAIVAVPALGYSTLPRANLFTTLLFAGVLTLVWQHHRDQRAPLWLLPLLMLAWVNLHPGFIAGLALLVGYLVLELLELPFADRRSGALIRLRRAAVWLAAAAAATMINPWGLRIYEAVVRQSRVVETHRGFVTEWSRTLRPGDALAWRSPESAFWWLLGAGLPALVILLWRKRFGVALLLLAATLLGLRYDRFQGLFAVAAVVLAGSGLEAAVSAHGKRLSPRWLAGLGFTLLAGMTFLVAIRISDLVSNRHFLSQGQIAIFGPGATRWYPERASAFLLRERLPGRLFNHYDVGGYLIWRLGLQYPVYADGRAVPFGPELFYRSLYLMQQPPDSPEWLREADLRSINTVIFPVTRYAGQAGILKEYCESRAWRPVYLDEVAAVFVRQRVENAAWLNRLQVDCATVRFSPPASRNPGELYNFYADSGWVLFSLGRRQEALHALERAQKIFPGDPHLYLIKGAAFQAGLRMWEAEQEFRAALRLGENANALYALGVTQANQGRFPEAAQTLARAARSSGSYEIYQMLGEVYLKMKQPQNALRAFDEAERRSPYRGPGAVLGKTFQVEVATGRALAHLLVGDTTGALSYQQQAVNIAPRDPARWLELAELYQAQGRSESAQQARSRAESLARDGWRPLQ